MLQKFSDALARVGGSQLSYRLAAARQELALDLRPGINEIKDMAEYLQAEAEELSLRMGAKGQSQ